MLKQQPKENVPSQFGEQFEFGHIVCRMQQLIFKQCRPREKNNKAVFWAKLLPNDPETKDAIQNEISVCTKIQQAYNKIGEASNHNHESTISFQQQVPIHSVVDFFKGSDQNINIILYQEMIGELDDLVITRTTLSEPEARSALTQILKGVQFLHDLTLVHRDLRAQTILLQNEEPLKVVISGYSFVCDWSQPENERELTELCGVPNIASPEIIQMKKPYGPYSDIWAIGVLAFYLFFGVLPFPEESNLEELFKSILLRKFDIENDRWTEISPAAKEFLDNLLITDTSKRWDIASALNSTFLKKN